MDFELSEEQRAFQQAARDFAPCGHLLGANQRRHVVHDEDHSVGALGAAKRGRHSGQLELPIVARQRDFLR